MFKCEDCGKVTQPNEKQVRVVVETRRKQYQNERREIVGEGVETVREKKVCGECGHSHTAVE